MNYVSVKPIKNIEVDTFVEDCNLFAVFECAVHGIYLVGESPIHA